MRTISAALAAVALVLVGGPALAQSTGTEVSASPDTVAVGEIATVTATGLGGLETAGFGLGDVSGAAMLSADGSTYDTSAQADVADGTASVSFMATEAGSYVVNVSDGETSLAETTVTVTAATPTETPTATPTETPTATASTPTETATPTPAPADTGVPPWVVVVIVVVAVLVIAGILVTVAVQAARRRGGTSDR